MPPPDVTAVPILHTDAIRVGFHLTDYIAADLASLKASAYLIITDENVARLHLEPLMAALRRSIDHDAAKEPKAVTRLLRFVVKAGEGSKSRVVKAEIEDMMLASQCTRDTAVVALGGGVVGDLAGFVAATFMRGIRFVQIPTTLLAMVDSSLGGKTAIDTQHGKNLIGAFWQPHKIYVDLWYLRTLPEREFRNGMAEVVKTAAIWDAEAFEVLEVAAEEIQAAVRGADSDTTVAHPGMVEETRSPGQTFLMATVLSAIRVKAHVVTSDERESGLRGLLNFGHSIGHAYEAELSPDVLHGECVSIGMMREAELARLLGHLDQSNVGRLERCLRAYNLPISLDDAEIRQRCGFKRVAKCTVDTIMDRMRIDKKNIGLTKKVVLLKRIGACVEERASVVRDEDIEKVLSRGVRVYSYPLVGTAADVSARVVEVPGSKSVSNRALVLAALGNGTCRLRGLLHSDDTRVMLQALKQMKACTYTWEEDGKVLVVQGSGGQHLAKPSAEVFLGNAGTAARFLTAVATLVPGDGQATVLTGNARMKQRPIAPLVEALRTNGQAIDYLESDGCLPLSMQGGGLAGGHIKLAASVSSQYVSALLLCAPYAQDDVVIDLTGGKVISQLYIDMTLAMMREFGAKVEIVEENVYRIQRATYTSPSEYGIESDASSATYPLAMAAITGTTVTVPRIGSASLQGDARFAVDVLRPMGCTVVQTENETTVSGPPVGQLRALQDIDMEPMTDAFLTASVLAAVANGGQDKVTRIRGIANQRVKECDRIRAMHDELARFGVESQEHPDGIHVIALPITKLTVPAGGVHCYDDHRVAMSFTVLASIVQSKEGTVLLERKCVEKTWPNWWDDYERLLGGRIQGFDVKLVPSPAAFSETIILIGMRGAGKTTLGRYAAQALGYGFVDLDEEFVAQKECSISEYVSEHDWNAFRAVELSMLEEQLKQRPTGFVIACGGGIIETEDARRLLRSWPGVVVHVQRDLSAIIASVGEGPSRPGWGESITSVWERRKPWYHECSSYEFAVMERTDWQREALRFFRYITCIDCNQVPNHLLMEGHTAFLSLTYPDLKFSFMLGYLPSMLQGLHAVELRVDLLGRNDVDRTGDQFVIFVRDQLRLLRHHTNLPIIFTVRTSSQGGNFPDGHDAKLFGLLAHAVRWGCEYIDVELERDLALTQKLLANHGNSQIIASWHDPKASVPWGSDEMRSRFQDASRIGDIVKIVSYAATIDDNLHLRQFVKDVCSAKPFIAINMGELGRLSRVFNQVFTPVTHEKLPKAAAPGQMSLVDIRRARHLIGMLPAKQFFLFGTPIRQSPSPSMHNAGFIALGLPHTYALRETSAVNTLGDFMRSNSAFGGASVTIPCKIDIVPLMDEVTPSARAIGAVNTVIVKDDPSSGCRTLVGDNTDWIGIARTAERLLETSVPKTVLVIGAGGTARAAVYAAQHLGATEILVWNRTESKALNMLKDMSKVFARILTGTLAEALASAPAFDLIISTVPASANIVLPPGSMTSERPGVLVELAYRPKETLVVLQAEAVGWKVGYGEDVLIEQGLEQFQRWTGFQAPRMVMASAVRTSSMFNWTSTLPQMAQLNIK